MHAGNSYQYLWITQALPKHYPNESMSCCCCMLLYAASCNEQRASAKHSVQWPEVVHSQDSSQQLLATDTKTTQNNCAHCQTARMLLCLLTRMSSSSPCLSPTQQLHPNLQWTNERIALQTPQQLLCVLQLLYMLITYLPVPANSSK